MNFNRVIIGGHMTRAAELRYTPGGTAVAQFGMAVNEKWTGEDGQKKENVCFIDCQVWGKRAEALAKHTGKGSPLLIEGTLKLDQWTDKQTQEKRSKHIVNVSDWEFAGDRKDGEK